MVVDLSSLGRGRTLKDCNGIKSLKRNQIGELSDDILLHILSPLTMKEVGRTSVLSKRWRHLWSYVPTLNFDSCYISHEISIAQKAREVEWPRNKLCEPDKNVYLGWVDQVLGSQKTPIIDEFMIQCHLQKDSEQSINDWVRFAMRKKVKRLGLDLYSSRGGQWSHSAFPSSFICNSLTSLELGGINITGDSLEILLYSCKLLEFLSVKGSHSLVDLKVDGPSLNLKYLILRHCNSLENLEISAPNLVYFNYRGPNISVPFKYTPRMLAEVSVGGDYAHDLTNKFMEHSSYLSQLEALTLNCHSDMDDTFRSIQFPELVQLKKLEVKVEPDPYQSIFSLKSLLKACPFLHKFVIQVNRDLDYGHRKPSRIRKARPHYQLKIVEIKEFNMHALIFEFAIYLLDIAFSLERVIVDPRNRLLNEFDSCKNK